MDKTTIDQHKALSDAGRGAIAALRGQHEREAARQAEHARRADEKRAADAEMLRRTKLGIESMFGR